MTRAPKIDDDALYECDGGMVLCGADLGMSARTTGRDLSGQRIRRMKDADAALFYAECEAPCACEMCGKALVTEHDHAALLAMPCDSPLVGVKVVYHGRALVVRVVLPTYRAIILTDTSGRIFNITADDLQRAQRASTNNPHHN